MPVIVKCGCCGKEFQSAIRKGRTAKYCSKPCYWKAWKGDHPELYKLPNRTCEECGKEFHPRDKEHGVRFCSRECQRKNGTLKRTVKCIVCGKEFQRDNASERFCSQDCFHLWNVGQNQKQFTDWLTHDERGYIRFTIGHPQYSGQYLHQVIWNEANPNAVCADCGGAVENVHHKDLDTSNNELSNLVGLCESCHHKRHYPKGKKIGSK